MLSETYAILSMKMKHVCVCVFACPWESERVGVCHSCSVAEDYSYSPMTASVQIIFHLQCNPVSLSCFKDFKRQQLQVKTHTESLLLSPSHSSHTLPLLIVRIE